MMKHRSKIKWLALCGVVALGLALTGCYIPPDEISDGTQDLTVGSNNLPFQTVAPAATATVTPTSAPVQTADPGAAPTVNWDAWGSTNAPAGATAQPGTQPTVNLPGNTIAVVTSVPTATPGPATPTPTPASLKKGMEGTLVREMQKRLKELGYYTGSVDGDFGEGTEAAVIEFQKANGLDADGKAGSQTMSKMNSNNAVSKKAAAQAQATKKPAATAQTTKKPSATATPDLSRDIYLEVGSSGSKVRTLQNRLIELGWLAGEADGDFGGATEKAVKAFQAREGIWDDGIAGPDTLKELYSSGAADTSTPVASIGVSLKEGMEGKSVRALQKRLKELDYYDGSVDGSFGAGTTAAVEAFQKRNGIRVDGVAGTTTLNKLYSGDAKKASSSGSVDTGSVSSTGYITLREGDESDAVKKLQRELKDRGYYSGSVDGKYGAGTTAAVEAFQRKNNLEVDGDAGPQTQRVLYGTSSSISYATLREGDSGSAVTNLQYTLYELGYYDAKIDGVYGDTTKDAVRAFQIRNKISPVDGVAGNKTLQKLYSSSAVAETASNSEYETLRKGAKGSAVIELQECLESLNYLASVTGVYDDATVEAVKNFQRYNGLSVDGTAGSDTLKKLYSDSATANPGSR